MTLQSKKYLDDILYSIQLIEEFVDGVDSFSEYMQDIKTRSAVERHLGIIGEAVNKIDKLNHKYSLKNTAQIVGLRNRIIYAYDNVNDDVVWAIIINHLPLLKKEVQLKLNS